MTPHDALESQRTAQTVSLEPKLSRLFLEWFRIGATSFGGGVSVLHMIDANFVRKNGWITASENTRLFAMCQLAPGINLLAMCLLIGWRVRGARGAFVSILGFILPSAAITVLVSLAYTRIRDLQAARLALRGMFAAIFGLGLVADWRFTQPLVHQARNDPRRVALVVVILGGSSLLYALFHPPVLVLYAFGAGLGAITAWYFARVPFKSSDSRA
jgi:chromate transporter